MDEIFSTLQENAARYPASIALASRAGHMNYENFTGNIASVAFAASRSGIEPGHLVVIAVGNQDAAIILTLALMRMGCRVGFTRNLPLYDESKVRVDAIIADKSTPDLGRPVTEITQDWFAGARADSQKLPPVASDCSFISSSSGSTGRPKLIESSTASICQRVNLRASIFSPIDGLRFLSLLGQRTPPSLLDTIAALLHGGMVIRSPGQQSVSILDTIQLYRPNFISVAPAVLLDVLRMLETTNLELPKVKMVRSTGAYLAPHLQEAAIDHLTEEIMSCYGTTETTWIAWGTSKDMQGAPGSVGRVREDVEVAAFDTNGDRLSNGAEGELRFVCPSDIACTFPGDQPAGRTGYVDGWFTTGDVGLVDENRNLIIRGRASNVINTGGAKVNPEAVEEQLLTFAGLLDVGVAGVDGPDGFQEICAAIVSASNQTVDGINQQLLQRGQDLAVHIVKNVEAIPKTENGKIDRTALKRLCAA